MKSNTEIIRESFLREFNNNKLKREAEEKQNISNVVESKTRKILVYNN